MDRVNHSVLFLWPNMLYVVRDSDSEIYGVFSTKEKADECVALVYKYNGVDPAGDFFGWWVNVDAFCEDEIDPRLNQPKQELV